MPSEEVIALNRGVGVIGAVPGIIGSIEALECIKILSGIGNPLYGRMILLDGTVMNFREIQIRKRADCSVAVNNEVEIEQPKTNSGSYCSSR
jgi:molybdopterin/thiamine biosynthesis adenylyltransferase